MLELGRRVLFLVAVAAGLGVLIYTVPGLAWVLQGVRMPADTGPRWIASVLVLIVALQGRRWLGAVARARIADALAAVHNGQAFEARGGPAALVLPAIAALFACLLWKAVTIERWDLAWPAGTVLLVALLLTWKTLLPLLRPGPMLRMDDACIDHALYGPIPWQDVIGIHLQTITTRHTKHHTLMLGVRGARHYARRAPAPYRWLQPRQLREARDIGTLRLPLDLIGRDADLIHGAALAFRARVDAPMLSLWGPTLHPRDADMFLEGLGLRKEVERLDAEERALAAGKTFAPYEETGAEWRAHRRRHDDNMIEMGKIWTRRAVLQQRWKRARRSGLFVLALSIVVLIVARFV